VDHGPEATWSLGTSSSFSLLVRLVRRGAEPSEEHCSRADAASQQRKGGGERGGDKGNMSMLGDGAGSSLQQEGRALVERLGGRWNANGVMCRCPGHDAAALC